VADGVRFVVAPFRDGRIPLFFRAGVSVGSQPWGVSDPESQPLVVEMRLEANDDLLQTFPAASKAVAAAEIDRLQGELRGADSLAAFLAQYDVPTHRIRDAVRAAEKSTPRATPPRR
jgi:hypothetical protein